MLVRDREGKWERGRESECVHIKKRKYKIAKLPLSPAWAEPRLVFSRKAKYKDGGGGGGCRNVGVAKGLWGNCDSTHNYHN